MLNIPQKVEMFRSLLRRDPLWFDSSKHPPLVSDNVSLSEGVFSMTHTNRKWRFCILVECQSEVEVLHSF